MERKDFETRFAAGQWPNVYRAVSLGAHNVDKRGDRGLALISEGRYAGLVVSMVWDNGATIAEAEAFSRRKFVWLENGFRTPGDDPAQWGPSLFLVCEEWSTHSAKDLAEKFHRVARLLDPERFSDFG